MNEETMNKIIKKLGDIGHDRGFFEYGLPVYDDGQMALMREAMTEIIEEEKTDE